MTDLDRVEKDAELQMEIPLHNGMSVIVDSGDYEDLSKYTWHALNNNRGHWIAVRYAKYKTVLMHRQILGFPDCESIDHRNGNPLDNRRFNLRPCTHAENNRNKGLNSKNKTGYKGVWWNKQLRKYKSAISYDSKIIYLGVFDNPIEAAKVYDQAAIKYHGEFAYQNFPLEQADRGEELERVLG